MAGGYEEVVNKIPLAEQAIGPLAGLAKRLDYLGPRVINTENRVERIEDALATLEVEGVTVMPKKIEQIPFPYNLGPGAGAVLSEHAPFSGYIKQVSIHWPDGCNGLLDIRVGHGTVQFCPDEGYLALNDATPTYPFNEWVEDQEEIWVEMRNAGGFAHRVTTTVILEGAA